MFGKKKPGTGAQPIAAADHTAFTNFVARNGVAPGLVGWSAASDIGGLEPSYGHLEYLIEVESVPPIHYEHVLLGYDAQGDIQVIVTAETTPNKRDALVLTVFHGGSRQTQGEGETVSELDAFLTRAAPIAQSLLAPASAGADRDVLFEKLNGLRAGAQRVWETPASAELKHLLEETSSVLRGLQADHSVTLALDSAVASLDDAEAQFRAGYQLIDAGLDDLAVAPLSKAHDLRPAHVLTIIELCLALDAVNRPDEAARLWRSCPDTIAQSEPARALYSHYAAMVGDLETVRGLVDGIGGDGSSGVFHQRAVARLSRYDSIRPLSRPGEGDLRGWELVLNGTLLLHLSDPEQDMNGRYAMVWDRQDRFAGVLSLLQLVLTMQQRTPTKILFVPDRDSEILAWALTERLRTGPPAPADLGQNLDNKPPVGDQSLVIAYHWGAANQDVLRKYRENRATTLFAYSFDWTNPVQLAPDIAGLHAQHIEPLWGARMYVRGEPGTPDGEVVNEPPDDRPPSVVGQETATFAGELSSVDREDVLALLTAMNEHGADSGITTGQRDRYYADGPVASSRFI